MKLVVLAAFVFCILSVFSQPSKEISGVLLTLRYSDNSNAAEIVRDVRVGYQNKHKIEIPELSDDGNILLKECPDDANLIRVSIEYGSEIFRNTILKEVKLENGNGGKVAEIVLPKLQIVSVSFANNKNSKRYPDRIRGVVSRLEYKEKSISDYLIFGNSILEKSLTKIFVPSYVCNKSGEVFFYRVPDDEFNITFFTDDSSSSEYKMNGKVKIVNQLKIPLLYKTRDVKIKVKSSNNIYHCSYSWNGLIDIKSIKSNKNKLLNLNNLPPVPVIIWNNDENFVCNPDNSIIKKIVSSDISKFYISMPELNDKAYKGYIYGKNIIVPKVISSDLISFNQMPGINASGYSGTFCDLSCKVNTGKNGLIYNLHCYLPFFADTDYAIYSFIAEKQ
jgi:hypothetical protein